MILFDSLSEERKERISERFILPKDTSKVEVDGNYVPYIRVSGELVGCTVRNDNFHVHGNKQNR